MEPSSSAAPGILTDPSEFEAYLARVGERLQSRWEQRCGFLDGAAGRLERLQQAAEGIGDSTLVSELSGHQERAAQTLAELKRVGPQGTVPASPPVPLPPSTTPMVATAGEGADEGTKVSPSLPPAAVATEEEPPILEAPLEEEAPVLEGTPDEVPQDEPLVETVADEPEEEKSNSAPAVEERGEPKPGVEVELAEEPLVPGVILAEEPATAEEPVFPEEPLTAEAAEPTESLVGFDLPPASENESAEPTPALAPTEGGVEPLPDAAAVSESVPAAPPEQDWHSVLQRFWNAAPTPAPEGEPPVTAAWQPPSLTDDGTKEGPAEDPVPVPAAFLPQSAPEPAEVAELPSAPVPPPPFNGIGLSFFGAESAGESQGPVGEPFSPPAPPDLSQPAQSSASTSPAFMGWDLDINMNAATAPATFDTGLLGTAPASLAAADFAPVPTAPAQTVSAPEALGLHIVIGDRHVDWSLAGDTAVLGRRDATGQNRPEIDLWPDHAVSRRHAQISRRNGEFFLQDLGSSNGTQVNGQPLGPHVEHVLRNGDEVMLGELTTLRVRIHAPDPHARE